MASDSTVGFSPAVEKQGKQFVVVLRVDSEDWGRYDWVSNKPGDAMNNTFTEGSDTAIPYYHGTPPISRYDCRILQSGLCLCSSPRMVRYSLPERCNR